MLPLGQLQAQLQAIANSMTHAANLNSLAVHKDQDEFESMMNHYSALNGAADEAQAGADGGGSAPASDTGSSDASDSSGATE